MVGSMGSTAACNEVCDLLVACMCRQRAWNLPILRCAICYLLCLHQAAKYQLLFKFETP